MDAGALGDPGPRLRGTAYQNFIDPTIDDWQQAYYGDDYERLVDIKTQVDPHDYSHFATIHTGTSAHSSGLTHTDVVPNSYSRAGVTAPNITIQTPTASAPVLMYAADIDHVRCRGRGSPCPCGRALVRKVGRQRTLTKLGRRL